MATRAELLAAAAHLAVQARQCDELAQTASYPGPYIVAAQRYGQASAVCFGEAEKIAPPSPPSLREVSDATQRVEARWPGSVVEQDGEGYALRRADGVVIAWGPSSLACVLAALEKIPTSGPAVGSSEPGSPTQT